MEKENKNTIEKDYLWLLDCIDSCTAMFHLDCCQTLISLFNIKYGDKGKQYGDKLLSKLLAVRAKQPQQKDEYDIPDDPDGIHPYFW